MHKRLKSIFLLAIIVASSVVGTLSMTNDASAATANLYLAPKMKDEAKASAYRVALALCTELGDLDSSLGETTSASNIASGKWFAPENGEPQVRVGYLVDTDNGQTECRNLFGGPVAKTLGWNSNIELACGIGYTRTNGSNCVNGTGDFTKNSTNKNEIYQKIDAKGHKGYTNQQYYVMAANTLITTCGWKPVTNVSDATADQKNSDNLETVKVVTGTGKVVDVLYRRDDNGKKAFRNTENTFDYITENCDWMKDRMNQYAATYADYVAQNKADEGDNAGPGTGTGEGAEEDETKSSCVITGIGWIICPVINFLAQVADTAYEGVEKLMQVQPLAVEGNSATYTAWAAMRDLANVAFVIAFLIIVFSQLTSIGITNYGIKKMLPRLILAAVLVNVSYWICAIAIDLSNIIGSSLYDIFNNIAKTTGSDKDAGFFSGGSWLNIAGSVTAGLVGAAIVYTAIGALLPALITVAFAIAAIFIVLSARQALIILWVVASPLAFVAYLLPNTESLYKKWLTFGKTLLLLYAVIALLFGASQLASAIVVAASNDIIIQIMGGVISVVPLFLTPFMIKASSGIAGKLGGFINNPNKGPFDKARKRAEAMGNRIEGRRQIGALTGNRPKFLSGKYRREARRSAIDAGISRNAQQSATSYVADQAVTDTKFQNKLAGGTSVPGWVPGSNALNGQLNASTGAQNVAMANALNDQQAIRAKEIQATAAVLDHMDINSDDSLALAQGEQAAGLDGGNYAVRAAAMQRVANTGNVDGMNKLLDGIGDLETSTRQDLVDALKNSSEKPAYLSPGVLAALREGKTGVNQIVGTRLDSQGNEVRDVKTDGQMLSISEQLAVNAINNNTYSPQKLATTSKDELKAIADIATDGKINVKRDVIGNAANTATSDSRLANQIGKNRDQVNRLAALHTPTPTPPSPGPTPPPSTP